MKIVITATHLYPTLPYGRIFDVCEELQKLVEPGTARWYINTGEIYLFLTPELAQPYTQAAYPLALTPKRAALEQAHRQALINCDLGKEMIAAFDLIRQSLQKKNDRVSAELDRIHYCIVKTDANVNRSIKDHAEAMIEAHRLYCELYRD